MSHSFFGLVFNLPLLFDLIPSKVLLVFILLVCQHVSFIRAEEEKTRISEHL